MLKTEFYLLQALNKNALKWWLQRLQEERRDFNLKEQPAYTEVKNDFYGNIQGSSVFWLPKDKQGLIHPKQSPDNSPGNKIFLNLHFLNLVNFFACYFMPPRFYNLTL